MGVVVSGVLPADFPALYPHIKWAFESFSERSWEADRPEDFVDLVMTQKSQCWIAFIENEVVAVALTRVEDARERSVTMVNCSGRGREDWQEALVSTVQAWAKSIGATTFRAVCRPGWVPFLRTMGMRESHRLMEQKI